MRNPIDNSSCCGVSCYVPHLLQVRILPLKTDFILENYFCQDCCPQAEQMVRSTMHRLYKKHSIVAPDLLRLLFHIYIQGCDASVLLDSTSEFLSEKDTPPNQTLKGFHIIEKIISKFEEVCRATVSCADILVLSAREEFALAGGPSLPTGRLDSLIVSFPEVASYELPSPHDDIWKTLTSFASRGFDERETVSLLGAQIIGKLHCRFFHNHLYKFQGTGLPDPSLEAGYLNLMRSRCNNGKSHSEEPGMNMSFEGKTGPAFGTHYCKTLMQGKGILHTDQQLMASNDAAIFSDDHSYLNHLLMLMSPDLMRLPTGTILATMDHCGETKTLMIITGGSGGGQMRINYVRIKAPDVFYNLKIAGHNAYLLSPLLHLATVEFGGMGGNPYDNSKGSADNVTMGSCAASDKGCVV